MGEMADYYKEQQIGDEFYVDESGPTATVWVTREGQRIPVKDMTDVHLVNTIRYLRRQKRNQMMEAALRMAEFSEPPEGFWDDWADDSDVDDYLLRSCPTFETMLAEVRKRGLSQLAEE